MQFDPLAIPETSVQFDPLANTAKSEEVTTPNFQVDKTLDFRCRSLHKTVENLMGACIILLKGGKKRGRELGKEKQISCYQSVTTVLVRLSNEHARAKAAAASESVRRPLGDAVCSLFTPAKNKSKKETEREAKPKREQCPCI